MTDDSPLMVLAAAPFHAACQVSCLPDGHPARRRHGHNFLARMRLWAVPGLGQFPGDEIDAAQGLLADAVAPWDYQDLNDFFDQPTDENLCRALHRRLATVPGLHRTGVQSTADQGVDLTPAGELHVWRRFRFEAAHQLPAVPDGHPCGRMHGHGFQVVLHAELPLHDGQDMGIDYDQLAALWAPLHDALDHRCLNDIPGLDNPTSEVLAGWLYARLHAVEPALRWVSVYETSTAGCHHDGQHFWIWKDQRFEAAVQLRAAPDDHPARRLHGHSYLVRLHLCAPLDQVLGWTVDYGDVKRAFAPVYQQLDHHRLDQHPGLGDGGPAGVLQHIRQELSPQLPALCRADLYQAPGCGMALRWGEEPPTLPA